MPRTDEANIDSDAASGMAGRPGEVEDFVASWVSDELGDAMHRRMLLMVRSGRSEVQKKYIQDMRGKESILAALISTETFSDKTYTVSPGQAAYLTEKILKLKAEHPELDDLCSEAARAVSSRASDEVPEPVPPSRTSRGSRTVSTFKRWWKHATVDDYQSCDTVRTATYWLMYGSAPDGDTHYAMLDDWKGSKSSVDSSSTTHLLEENEG